MTNLNDLTKVSRTFKVLTKQEINVVKKVYGLDDGIKLTQAQTARALKLTRERVRVIHNSAVNKINIITDYESK